MKNFFKDSPALTSQDLRQKLAALQARKPALVAKIAEAQDDLVRDLAMGQNPTEAKKTAAEARAELEALPAAENALASAIAEIEADEIRAGETHFLEMIDSSFKPRIEKLTQAARAALGEYGAGLDAIQAEAIEVKLPGVSHEPFSAIACKASNSVASDSVALLEQIGLWPKVHARDKIRAISYREAERQRGLK